MPAVSGGALRRRRARRASWGFLDAPCGALSGVDDGFAPNRPCPRDRLQSKKPCSFIRGACSARKGSGVLVARGSPGLAGLGLPKLAQHRRHAGRALGDAGVGISKGRLLRLDRE